MADPAVAVLVREVIAFNNASRIAAGNERRVDQITAIRAALQSLRAALTLDPGRTDPVWRNQPPQDGEALTDRQMLFYVFVIGLADAGQF